MTLTVEHEAAVPAVTVHAERRLLLRALGTVIQLADAFSSRSGDIQLSLAMERGYLRLRAHLDALRLPPQQLSTFFEIESPARSASPAEPLGLSPVVANRIITALGGELSLTRGEGDLGEVEVLLATNLTPASRGDAAPTTGAG